MKRLSATNNASSTETMSSPPPASSISFISSTVRSVIEGFLSRTTLATPTPKPTERPDPPDSPDSPLSIPQTQLFSVEHDWTTVTVQRPNAIPTTSKQSSPVPLWSLDHETGPPRASTPLCSTGKEAELETFFESFDNEDEPLSVSKSLAGDRDPSEPLDPLNIRNGSVDLSLNCTPDCSIVVSDSEDGRPLENGLFTQNISPIQQKKKRGVSERSPDSRKGDELSIASSGDVVVLPCPSPEKSPIEHVDAATESAVTDNAPQPEKKVRKLFHGNFQKKLTQNQSIFLAHTSRPLNPPTIIRKPRSPIHFSDDDDFRTDRLCTQVASFTFDFNNEGREKLSKVQKIVGRSLKNIPRSRLKDQNEPIPEHVETKGLDAATAVVPPPTVLPKSTLSDKGDDVGSRRNATLTSVPPPIELPSAVRSPQPQLDPTTPGTNVNRTEGGNTEHDTREQECIEVSASARSSSVASARLSFSAPRPGSGRVEKRSTIDGIIAERGSPILTKSLRPQQGLPYSNPAGISKRGTSRKKNRKNLLDSIAQPSAEMTSPALPAVPRKEAGRMQKREGLSSRKVQDRPSCSNTVSGASVERGRAQISESLAGPPEVRLLEGAASFPFFCPKRLARFSSGSSMPWSRGNTPPPQDGGGYSPVRVGPDSVPLCPSAAWTDPLHKVFREQWQIGPEGYHEMFSPTVRMMEWWNDRAGAS